MDQFIAEHSVLLWLTAGALLVFLEVALAPGAGFLFAGLAAITVGGLATFGAIDSDAILLQFALFFVFTCLWTAILWKPLKRFRSRGGAKGYQDVIGSLAKTKNALNAGELGQVHWSGTIMNARIDKACKVKKIAGNQEVTVTAKKGNTLYVKPVTGEK